MFAARAIRQGPSVKVIISVRGFVPDPEHATPRDDIRPRIRSWNTHSRYPRVKGCISSPSLFLTFNDRGGRLYIEREKEREREKAKKARARDGARNGVEMRGALLANGTLALRRTRGVATLLRAVETAAPPVTTPRATKDTRMYEPRAMSVQFAKQVFGVSIISFRRRKRNDRAVCKSLRRVSLTTTGPILVCTLTRKSSGGLVLGKSRMTN